jgi:2-dehydropantoate 2-reductase
MVAGEGGCGFMQTLYRECLGVAESAGQPVSAETQSIALGTLTQVGSPVKASMLRDLEAGQRVEAAHIVGDMLHRARQAGRDAPLLAAAWCHLQAYEAGGVETGAS